MRLIGLDVKIQAMFKTLPTWQNLDENSSMPFRAQFKVKNVILSLYCSLKLEDSST
jgi:hypothetical protein